MHNGSEMREIDDLIKMNEDILRDVVSIEMKIAEKKLEMEDQVDMIEANWYTYLII